MSEEEDNIFRTRARSYSKTENKMAGKGSLKKENSISQPKEENGKDSEKTTELKKMEKPKTNNEWWDLMQTLTTMLSGVQTEPNNLKSLKGKVETLSNNFTKDWKEDTENKVQVLELCNSDIDFHVKLLTNIVIRLNQKIEELERKVESARLWEIRPNLIIHGLLEGRVEMYTDLIQKVKDFLKERMKIEVNIEILDAFRMGPKERHD